VETGFESDHVMTGIVSLPGVKYKAEATQAAFFDSVEQQLRRQPGVSDVAIADCVPFVNMCGSASFGIVGRTQAPNDPGPHGYIRSISPGYFSTLKIPVLQGRAFTASDRKGSAEASEYVIGDSGLSPRRRFQSACL
jgi:hypothetical protein